MILLEKEGLRNSYKSDNAFQKILEKYEYLFPIKSNPNLAGIIGDLMGDGHLQGYPKWRFDYTSKSKIELLRFENEIYNLFKIKGKIRPCKTNKFGKTYNYGVNCKPIARILNICGAPTGAKVLKKFEIPKWILKDKECFRKFTARLFHCEGAVDCSKNPFIQIEMYKDNRLLKDGISFFKTIKKYLFLHFNITSNNIFTVGTSIRKDGIITKGTRLRIKRKEEISKFIKEIGFPNEKKRLNKILISLKGNL